VPTIGGGGWRCYRPPVHLCCCCCCCGCGCGWTWTWCETFGVDEYEREMRDRGRSAEPRGVAIDDWLLVLTKMTTMTTMERSSETKWLMMGPSSTRSVRYSTSCEAHYCFRPTTTAVWKPTRQWPIATHWHRRELALPCLCESRRDGDGGDGWLLRLSASFDGAGV
jgi:hypothetical protein